MEKLDTIIPEIEPQPEVAPDEAPTPKKSKQAKKAAPSENIHDLGTQEIPVAKSNIHVMTIIGQIEGQPQWVKNRKFGFC